MKMKINNENEYIKNIFSSQQFMLNNETLHFMFSYKYSSYQIFMDACNET